MKIEWQKGETNPYDVVQNLIMDKFQNYIGDDFIVQLIVNGDDTTELLINNGYTTEDHMWYMWKNDWWEGQDDIELVGAAPVTQIDLHTYWNFDE